MSRLLAVAMRTPADVAAKARAAWIACILGSASLLAGCAPQTQYRHTAFVPAVRPIPFDGTTARAGTLRVEGTLSTSDVSPNLLPQPGDTALLVPRWTLEGSAMLAVSPHVEIGIRGAYADYGWTQVSAVGAMPLPTEPSSTGYGPEMRLSFPLSADGHFGLGLAGNLMLYTVPYAEWQLTGPNSTTMPTRCVPSSTCVADYTLVDTRSDAPIVYSLGVYPTYSIGKDGEYGHIVGLIDATSGFKNDGFSDKPANGSTLEGVGPIMIAGLGYGFTREWGRVSALAYRPFTDPSSPVDYGYGFQITIGVNIDLWHPEPLAEPAAPAPTPAPAPAPAPTPTPQ